MFLELSTEKLSINKFKKIPQMPPNKPWIYFIINKEGGVDGITSQVGQLAKVQVGGTCLYSYVLKVI